MKKIFHPFLKAASAALLVLVSFYHSFAQSPLSSAYFDIIITQKNAELVYANSGSGDTKDFASIWKPVPPPGYYHFGHIFSTKFVKPGDAGPPTFMVKPKPGFESLLAAPVSYTEIWNNNGNSTRSFIGKVYKVNCPAGYVALGMSSATGMQTQPADNACRCIMETYAPGGGKPSVRLVSRAKYTTTAKEGNKGVYDTRNFTKILRKASFWKPAISAGGGKDQACMVPNTFFLTPDSYDTPPSDIPYALNLTFETGLNEPIAPAKRPQLKTNAMPSPQEMEAFGTTNEYTVPFLAIKDNQYASQLEQFLASPTYRVVRNSYYRPIQSLAADAKATTERTQEYAVTVGLVDESNHSTAVGITAGMAYTMSESVEVGAGVAKASASSSLTLSLEASLSTTWGGSTTKSKQETSTFRLGVPPGAFGVLFQDVDKYRVYRKDGTEVQTPYEVFAYSFSEALYIPEANKAAAASFTPSNPVAEKVVSDPSLFDATWYLTNNPDIVTSGFTGEAGARKHFIEYGMVEGRQSGPAFDVVYYRYTNPDLQKQFDTDYAGYYKQYMQFGKREGRKGIK